MLQDDNNRLLSEKEGDAGSLQALEDGVKTLQLAEAAAAATREGEHKATTAYASVTLPLILPTKYASVDLPQVLPSKEYIIEKIGQESKRYTSNFAISLETPENYFGYYSEHFYGNGVFVLPYPTLLCFLIIRFASY